MEQHDPGRQMADVFAVLAKDHDEVKGMRTELEKGPTRATRAGEDQLALRKKMTKELIIEASKHEAIRTRLPRRASSKRPGLPSPWRTRHATR
jgi:hypothetical protein